MDKMSFFLDYDYYYPRFLDREVCVNSVDPDQTSHYALCVQGLHYFTLTQQCLDKSVDSIMADRQTDVLFRRKLLQFLVYQHAHMTISYGHNIYMADNK